MGRTFLILVDAHSKWLEVVPVSTPSSQQAIKALRHIFSTHGLPEVLVADNGSAFTSMDFATFVKRNGFRHIRCAPYHPASNINGLAERAVQTFKEAMKKMVTEGGGGEGGGGFGYSPISIPFPIQINSSLYYRSFSGRTVVWS